VISRVPRLVVSRWLLAIAPVLYGLAYAFPWENLGRQFYGSDWWWQLWMMAKMSPRRITGLAVAAAMPLQMMAAPFLLPALRGSAFLRWMTRGFAILIVWQVVVFLRSSRFYMGYLEEWSMLGPGRWLEMISFCLHAAGLWLLPPQGGKEPGAGHDSAAGSR